MSFDGPVPTNILSLTSSTSCVVVVFPSSSVSVTSVNLPPPVSDLTFTVSVADLVSVIWFTVIVIVVPSST